MCITTTINTRLKNLIAQLTRLKKSTACQLYTQLKTILLYLYVVGSNKNNLELQLHKNKLQILPTGNKIRLHKKSVLWQASYSLKSKVSFLSAFSWRFLIRHAAHFSICFCIYSHKVIQNISLKLGQCQ